MIQLQFQAAEKIQIAAVPVPNKHFRVIVAMEGNGGPDNIVFWPINHDVNLTPLE